MKEKIKVISKLIICFLTMFFVFVVKEANAFEYVFGTADFGTPSVTQPDQWDSYIDPDTNMSIRRITNIANDVPGATSATIYYNRWSSTSSDGRYLNMRVSGRGGNPHYIMDLQTQTTRVAPHVTGNVYANNGGLDAQPEYRWDKSGNNPNWIYYRDGLKFYRGDVNYPAGQPDDPASNVLIHDFADEYPTGQIAYNDGEGDSSADGRYWVFMIRPRSGSPLDFITYDIETDTIAGRWSDSKGRPTFKPNFVDIAPTGDRVFAEDTLYDIDWDTNPLKIVTRSAHSGWAFDKNGVSSFVQINGVPSRDDELQVSNIYDGTNIRLLSQGDLGWNSHHMMRMFQSEKRGWVFMNLYSNSGWSGREIIAVETVPEAQSPRIWRVAHSMHGSGNPHPTLSYDGTKIYFNSNWQGTDNNEIYEISLPDNWWQDLNGASIYQCSDGVDNDSDGLTDYPNDPGCSSTTDNDEYNAPNYQCSDGFDNDSDGLTDYPNDPGCSSTTDNDEYNAPNYQCSDGFDNDSDGLTDYPNDPGCSSTTDNDEYNAPNYQCSDGFDNDSDGLTDYPNDPGCSSTTDDDEYNTPNYQCSDGFDNDSDGLTDYPNDPGCSSTTDDDEYNAPNYQCSDGFDNDSDGLTDYPNDPGCSSTTDDDEYNTPNYQCSDGLDNDSDGLTDYPNDPGCSSTTDNDEYNAPNFDDYDGDGVSDIEEGITYDGNGDGIADRLQSDVATLNTATGSGLITIFTGSGALANVTSYDISDLPSSPTSIIVEEEDCNIFCEEFELTFDFPYGLYDFQVIGLTPGETIQVALILPDSVPQDGAWYFFNSNTITWDDFSAYTESLSDGDNVVLLNLADGGAGDRDGIANGIIEDPSGFTSTISNSLGGGCFIATAAYGSYLNPHVKVLRDFRDNYLLTNLIGKVFVDFYYFTSPSIANIIKNHESLKTATRFILTPIIFGFKYPVVTFLILGFSIISVSNYRKIKSRFSI